ncbi:MAG TPA: PilZ domain-containing protein [Armatimonadota bacterium]|nr:PilZ domain-containing protein [Armatimonadota bacterium]
MADRKDTAPDWARGKKQDITHARKGARTPTNHACRKTYSSPPLPGPSGSEMPVPLKGIRATSANDTGVAFSVVQDSIAPDHEEGHPPVMGLGELLNLHRETFVRLEQPLLVGLKLTHSSSEEVRVYCGSREIQRGGIRLILPCQLDLIEGTVLDMELFLPSVEQPIAVSGQVRKVSRIRGEDIMRYVLEVEFGSLSREAGSKIAAFVEASQAQEHRGLPA